MARSDIKAGKAFVELYVKDSSFVKGLRGASANLRKFGSSVGEIGQVMRGAGTKAVGFGSAIAGGLFVAVKSASDLQETMNKFDVVFGKSSGAVQAWSDEFGSAVGRSKNQVRGFMANTQDLLVPLGFAADAATGMSKEITTLAVDLASFNNMSDADVIRDLHAALTGSGEVMKKYGVIVSEAAVKQEMLNNGLDPKKATDQQKVQARMAIIMRGTTAAQGDALRSSGSYENQMKALKATLSDTSAVIGTALLPMVTEWVTKAREIVGMVADWVQKNPELIKQIAMIALKVVAAGAALLALGYAITTTVTVITTITGVLGAMIAILTNPVGFVLFASAGAAAFALRDDLKGAFGDIKEGWGAMMEALKAGDLTGAWKILAATISGIWDKMYSSMKVKTESFLLNASQSVLGVVGLDDPQYQKARLAAARTEHDLAVMQADRARQAAIEEVRKKNEAIAEGEDPRTKAKRYMDEILAEADEAKKSVDTRGPVAGGFSASALARLGAGPRNAEREMAAALGKIAADAKFWKSIHDLLRDRLKLPEFT